MTQFEPTIFSSHSSIRSGVLQIGGRPVSDLAAEFGTPLFVVDEADFKERALAWKSALIGAFGSHAGTVYYAGKAFLCKEVARWVEECGIGLDVCTGGELAVASAVNFPFDRIEVHGNNKSEAEIRTAVALHAGTIVLDSFCEIERVERIASELGRVQRLWHLSRYQQQWGSQIESAKGCQ